MYPTLWVAYMYHIAIAQAGAMSCSRATTSQSPTKQAPAMGSPSSKQSSMTTRPIGPGQGNRPSRRIRPRLRPLGRCSPTGAFVSTRVTKTIAVIILLSSAVAPAHATVVNPSGHDDTAAIQQVCNAGQIVELVRGTYHISSITCKDITGKSNGDPYFYYEGQTPTINIIGSAGPRGAIVCPLSGACAYSSFNVQPGVGSAGFVMDNVHSMKLTNISVVDLAGTGGSCIDANTSGTQNQLLVIQSGTFQHCGGWCVDSNNLDDSTFIGAVFSNCLQGLIRIQYGFGNRFVGNYIEDAFSKPGLELDGGGASLINGNSFDTNQQDMMFGAGYYASVTGNMSCRNGGNGMFDIEGNGVFINASGNEACAPTYYVSPNVTSFFGRFNDPNPSYVDQHSSDIISPWIQ